MKIVVSEKPFAKEHGKRIRAAAPGAKVVWPTLDGDGNVRWSSDPAGADACFFSEDFWSDLPTRQSVLPVVFRLEGLRWFHTFSAGTDAGAFKAMIERGTILTNSSGGSGPSIAQYVLAMMLYCTKPIEQWREQQTRGEWSQLPAGELTGQTCGIIGTGAIGGEVARLAKAFGMRTVGMRRSEKKARWIDEQVTPKRPISLLKQSDFVVLACPLTRQTEGLIGERELRTMKATATLINVSRGRVCVEGPLITALPNVIVTPHNSGSSPLNMGRALEIFLDNLECFSAGRKMRNVATLSP